MIEVVFVLGLCVEKKPFGSGRVSHMLGPLTGYDMLLR
jgi:hypothetical protein